MMTAAGSLGPTAASNDKGRPRAAFVLSGEALAVSASSN
jgi:hypothetical protein